MAFNSYSYLLALFLVTALYWLLPPNWKRGYLLTMSAAYYATWKLEYTLLPFVVCAGVYFAAQSMRQQPARAYRYLLLGISFVLSFLLFFKYRDFLLVNLSALLSPAAPWTLPGWAALALPLGLSFYTFEAISYLVDSYQGRIKQATFADLCLFVMFWPHMMAGPIVRFRELYPQFTSPAKFELPVFLLGLDRLLWGLVQKNLFANNLSPLVNEGFLPQAAALNSTIDNWYLAVAFGLQIYFDFAGYSNMAIGAAQLVGIQLPLNFRFPYHAANPSDFWARWHMTLSRWIRDYLFFPVNARFRGAPGPLYLSLIAIMALVGLWHGAGWGFVLWGFLHGIWLVIYRIWERFEENGAAWAKSTAALWALRLFTLGAVMFTWIPFRATTLDQSVQMMSSMLFQFRFHLSYSANYYLIVALLGMFVLVEPWIFGWIAEQPAANKIVQPDRWRLWLRPLFYAGGLFLFLLFDSEGSEFIYFQF